MDCSPPGYSVHGISQARILERVAISFPGSGRSPRKESDMTERLHFHFSLSCIGEENGISLQCSCLENPRDGGAWWAAISGVTESDTTEAT